MSLNSKRSYIKQCQQTLHGIKSKQKKKKKSDTTNVTVTVK